GRCSNTAMIPSPIAPHPKPARNPAVAPHASVVPGAFKNIARLNAITRLNRNAIANPFGPAAGGSVANPFARFHAAPSSTGEYHNPPIKNAETAAAMTAQMFSVCRFILLAPQSSFAWRCRLAEDFLPVDRATYKARVKRRHQLRSARHQVPVSACPLR